MITSDAQIFQIACLLMNHFGIRIPKERRPTTSSVPQTYAEGRRSLKIPFSEIEGSSSRASGGRIYNILTTRKMTPVLQSEDVDCNNDGRIKGERGGTSGGTLEAGTLKGGCGHCSPPIRDELPCGPASSPLVKPSEGNWEEKSMMPNIPKDPIFSGRPECERKTESSARHGRLHMASY